MQQKTRGMKRVACFWGSVTVPARMRVEHATALAYLAWKGGVHEDKCTKVFARWFRRLAKERPDLAQVHVFDVYPVDEFRFLGKYDTDSSGPEQTLL